MTAARSAPGPTGQAVDPAEPTDPGATGAPAVSDPAAADTTGGRRSSGAWWLAALLVAAAVLVSLQVHASPILSPIDEFQHIDYLARASHFSIPREGDLVGQETMRAEACRKVDAVFTAPACDATNLTPEQFQEFGVDTAASDPPLYYVTGGLVARGLQHGFGMDFVTAGRLVGVLWLWLAVIFTWLLLSEIGVPLAARAAAIGLMLASPAVLQSTTTVTSDATLLAVGAGLMWATVRWERGRLPLWVPALIAGLGAAAKETNLVAVGVAVVYLLLRALLHRDAVRRAVVASIIVGGAGLAVSGAWLVAFDARARVDARTLDMNRRFHVESLQADNILDSSRAMFPPVAFPATPPPLRTPFTSAVADVTNWLLIGGLLSAVFYARRGGRLEAAAVAALVVLLVSGPLLVVTTFVFSSTYFPVPARYGLGVVPVLILLLATALRKRAVQTVVSLLAGSAVLYTAIELALH